MTEIHNNKDLYLKKAAPAMKGQKTDPTLPSAPENNTSTKDLNVEMQTAEVLGRSMVNFKGKDSLEKDVEFMLKNPEIVEDAIKFYDMVEKEHGSAVAAHLMRGFAEEFKN